MSKTYREALQGASLLLEKAGIPADGANFVLASRLHWSRSQLILHGRDEMSAAVAEQFNADLHRLLQNEPAQYIVGTAPFWGRDFAVDERVLIPRFDTELLVEWVLNEQTAAQTGLDLGTGSGAIGITLKLEQPQLKMTLSDLSAGALVVSRQNAQTLGADVEFVQSDLLANIDGRFDFIVSNLPYIDVAEQDVMDTSTKLFEPALALYAPQKGLALFEQLFRQLPAHLNPDAAAYLEFGYHQQPALERMISTMLPDASAEFRCDDAGNPRAVKISF
ncbi:peptide chain release factor N(5)-glutamine methyltransferase [Lacticaseibacillus zhaodongensis]|uniref:peptide chain release factor N(5)-glutamine methyltransferase n=1 Tax=Lacticaseibacillus zhaodongensis TaxID=2668065 RepID=UPI0012D33BC1|nr:peptide chain release factor N(5)-glutamine methyltransferase [Lacticaseibacillus zhaodongensis]